LFVAVRHGDPRSFPVVAVHGVSGRREPGVPADGLGMDLS
jgi:hypothetical protein